MLQKLTSAVPFRISASPFCLNWPQAVPVMKKPQKSDGFIRGANPRLITGLPTSLKRQVWEMTMKKKSCNVMKHGWYRHYFSKFPDFSLIKMRLHYELSLFPLVCSAWREINLEEKMAAWNPGGEKHTHVSHPRISQCHFILAVFFHVTHDGLSEKGANFSLK